MKKTTIAVVVSEGKVSAVGSDTDWEIWLITVNEGRVVRKEKRRPPFQGIFPPGYMNAMAARATMPRFGAAGVSVLDLVGYLEGADILLAKDFWPGVTVELSAMGIACVKTEDTDPEEAALGYVSGQARGPSSTI
ncbi:MAG: hypothetical protein ACP5QG_08170 [candidate division WOR-3 bacterium]